MMITPDVVRTALSGLPESESPWLSLLDKASRRAAVALPIRFDPEPFVVAILRSTILREHAGQLAFPGGKVEPADVDLFATALRETEEEVGLALERGSLLGTLTPLPTYNGRYLIHPYVVHVGEGSEPFARSAEIDRVVRLPILPYLRGERVVHAVVLPFQGIEILTPHFKLEENVLFGASALIFFELCAKLAATLGVTMPEPVLEAEPPWGDRPPV